MTTLANGLVVDESTWNSPNYSAGRPSGVIGVTIHWWGLPEWKQSFNQVADYLSTARGNASTSAHYVVSDTRVACLVSPTDRAWHALEGNEQTVGLELDPNGGAGTLENACQIIAMLEEYFGKSLNVYPHNYWVSTQCPGHYADRIAWLVNRVQEIRAGATLLPQATEKVTEAITTNPDLMEDIMAIFDTREDFVNAIAEGVQRGLNPVLVELTPGEAGKKRAGALYSKLDEIAEYTKTSAYSLTPGEAGKKTAGAVYGKMDTIAGKE